MTPRTRTRWLRMKGRPSIMFTFTESSSSDLMLHSRFSGQAGEDTQFYANGECMGLCFEPHCPTIITRAPAKSRQRVVHCVVMFHCGFVGGECCGRHGALQHDEAQRFRYTTHSSCSVDNGCLISLWHICNTLQARTSVLYYFSRCFSIPVDCYCVNTYKPRVCRVQYRAGGTLQ